MVSKLRERLANEQRFAPSKIQDRQTSNATQDIQQARYNQALPQLNAAYQGYTDAFQNYEKEREDYSKALEEWKEKEEREKELAEYEAATGVLTQSAGSVEQAYQRANKTPNKEIQKFKSSIIQEKEQLKAAEIENEVRVDKLDTETAADLESFSYYEGLGFAKGDIDKTGFKIVNGGGIQDVYYGKGDYSLYDPSTGKITDYTANPLSTNLGVKADYQGKEYELEQLDELNPQVTNKLDAYLSNPDYVANRDDRGNITSLSSSDNTEQVFVSNGMIDKIVKKGKYKTNRSEYGEYDTETTSFDDSGLISSYVRKRAIPVYKGADYEKVVDADIKSYQYGVPVLETSNSFYDGGISVSKTKDWMKGEEQVTSDNDSQTFQIGKIKPLSEEAVQNVQKYGGGLALKRDYMLAKPGEEQYRQTTTFTEGGNVYSVSMPQFAAPTVRGGKEAMFGTQKKAEQVLGTMRYAELGYQVPLQNYQEVVARKMQKQRMEYYDKLSWAVIPTQKGNTYIVGRKKLKDAEKIGNMIGGNFSIYTPSTPTTW